MVAAVKKLFKFVIRHLPIACDHPLSYRPMFQSRAEPNYVTQCNERLGVQEYIENENSRLEREQQFWAKEIVVKISYKWAPRL